MGLKTEPIVFVFIKSCKAEVCSLVVIYFLDCSCAQLVLTFDNELNNKMSVNERRKGDLLTGMGLGKYFESFIEKPLMASWCLDKSVRQWFSMGMLAYLSSCYSEENSANQEFTNIFKKILSS